MIALDRLHVLERYLLRARGRLALEQLGDPPVADAGGIAPVEAQIRVQRTARGVEGGIVVVGVPGGVAVRSRVVALQGVHSARQRQVGHPACRRRRIRGARSVAHLGGALAPLCRPRVPRKREPGRLRRRDPVPPRNQRMRVVPNVALVVREHEVLCADGVVLQRRERRTRRGAVVSDRAGVVQIEERLEVLRVPFMPRPTDADRRLRRGLVVDDRAVVRHHQHRRVDRRPALYRDRHRPDRDRHVDGAPGRVAELDGCADERRRIAASRKLLLVQVGDVIADHRDTPAHVRPASDQRAGNAGERAADDVQPAAVAGGHRREMEERRELQREVRIVRHHRLAGGGVRSVDHPVVRPRAIAHRAEYLAQVAHVPIDPPERRRESRQILRGDR